MEYVFREVNEEMKKGIPILLHDQNYENIKKDLEIQIEGKSNLIFIYTKLGSH